MNQIFIPLAARLKSIIFAAETLKQPWKLEKY